MRYINGCVFSVRNGMRQVQGSHSRNGRDKSDDICISANSSPLAQLATPHRPMAMQGALRAVGTDGTSQVGVKSEGFTSMPLPTTCSQRDGFEFPLPD